MSRGRKIQEGEDHMKKCSLAIRSSQVQKLETFFPASQGLQSKALQASLNMFIRAMDEYGAEFSLAMILGKGGYKIVPESEVEHQATKNVGRKQKPE